MMGCLRASVFSRGAADHPFEHAVKLWVTAEPGFQGGIEQFQPATVSEKSEKPLHALAVPEIHEGNAGLLFEQAAEP